MAAFLGQIPADVITAYVAIAVAAGTAFWTVTRFVADRRAARAEATALAEQELRQRRHEEARSREHHAAELIRAVGQATDPVARRWTMSALSLYPDQTLDLLLTSLGDAGPEDTATIKLAVLSVGPRALPKTVRAHRIARTAVRHLGRRCRLGRRSGGCRHRTAGDPAARPRQCRARP